MEGNEAIDALKTMGAKMSASWRIGKDDWIEYWHIPGGHACLLRRNDGGWWAFVDRSERNDTAHALEILTTDMASR